MARAYTFPIASIAGALASERMQSSRARRYAGGHLYSFQCSPVPDSIAQSSESARLRGRRAPLVFPAVFTRRALTKRE